MMKKAVGLIFALSLCLSLLPDGLLAVNAVQEPGGLVSQDLRGYTHMFIAYFIAWALILGWVISIARRLGRVEKALKE
jgi:CcmD family protein